MGGFPDLSKVSLAHRKKRDFLSHLEKASPRDKENTPSTFSRFNALELPESDAS